jgi:hypothetical protein
MIWVMSPKQYYILLIVSTLTFWHTSCENQNEEDLFGQTDCDTSQVSYSGYVESLLEDHCYRCHSTANLIAPFSLEGYANVQIRVSSGQLYGALNHIQGYQPMPRDEPKLPECDLAKINSWIREGAPNN